MVGALQARGHKVRMVASAVFRDWIDSHGIEGVAAGLDIHSVMMGTGGQEWVDHGNNVIGQALLAVKMGKMVFSETPNGKDFKKTFCNLSAAIPTAGIAAIFCPYPLPAGRDFNNASIHRAKHKISAISATTLLPLCSVRLAFQHQFMLNCPFRRSGGGRWASVRQAV